MTADWNAMSQIQKILTETHLYQPIPLTNKDEEWVEALGTEHFSFDCFCPECGQTSTYGTRGPGDKDNIRSEAQSMQLGIRLAGGPGVLLNQKNTYFSVTGYCARNVSHVAKFYFQVRNKRLTKVGQNPSIADLSSQELRQYEKVLGKEWATEMHRAVGLASHGVGIGSFVYLRRIFEGLIEKHRASAEAGGATFPDWLKLRLTERIQLLKASLPKLVVENPEIYSLLSAGVHTWTEDKCKAAFPVLKEAILVILQQDAERREREKREKELKTALANLNQSSSSNAGSSQP